MSTKTTFKRIALVTVAALATGVLTSVSPANAAAGAYAVGDLATTTAASASNYGVLSATTSGTTSTYEMLVNGQAYFSGGGGLVATTNLDNAKYSITSGSGSITYITDSAAGTAITGVLATDGQTATWTGDGTKVASGIGFAYKPSAVGTTTILYTKKVGAVVSTVETIKIIAVASAAASASGVLSVADSFFSRETATATVATDNVDASTSAIANGGTGWVGVALKDAFGGSLATGSIVVSATGGAKVAWGADATSTSLSNAYASDNGASDWFSVIQGTANVALSTTVTLTYNGTIVGVKSFTFTGDIAKIKVSATAADGLLISAVGSPTTSYKVYAYDAADNQIAYAVAVDSSKYTPVFTAQSVTSPTSTSTFVQGGWTCGKAGTATMRVKATNLAGATIYSNDFTAQCGGSVDKYTASLDKTSYVPGDIATLTVKAVDSSNFPVNDAATLGGAGALVPAIAGSNLTPVSSPLAADTFTWGTKTYKFIVGPTSGSYALAVDLPGYGSVDSAKTVSYKIAGGSATLESVLAAIVKLIAAINKQIAQLAKKK